MNTKKALIAMCALALSASPALALNKGRPLSGVINYNPGVSDGTITSTFISTPVFGYTLQITSPQFSSGIAGVNAPKVIPPAQGKKGIPPIGPSLITVNNFSSYTCNYTTPGNVNVDNLLAVTVQNQADGLFYTAQGTSVQNGSTFSYAVTASNLQNNGLPAGATVVLADLLFFGGSDVQSESVTASNFAINGSNTVSVSNGFFVFSTQPDSIFNYGT